MDIHRKDPGRQERPGLVVCIVALLLLLIPAAAACADDLGVSLEIPDNPVGVRDRVYINIYVDYPNVAGVSVQAPAFPPSLALISGPGIKPYADENDTNKPDKTRISYIFRATEGGRYFIDAFQVTAGGKSGSTKPTILSIGTYRNKQIVIPLDAKWKLPDHPVYVGEAVPVYLELVDLSKILLVESFKVTKPTYALIADAPDLGEINIERHGNAVLYQVPVTSFVITPSRSGRILIPSAGVSAGGLTAETGAAILVAQPLPSEASGSGGVGTFSMRAWADSANLSTGVESVLHVRIQGEGNLNYLQLPTPDFGEMVVVNKRELSGYVPGPHGFTGWREDQYRFVSDKSGNAVISVPATTWIDATTRQPVRWPGVRLSLSVSKSNEVQQTAAPPFPFKPQAANTILGLTPADAYLHVRSYLWLIPAPLAFLLVLILKRTRVILVSLVCLLMGAGAMEQPSDAKLDAALTAYHAGNYDQARQQFQQALNKLPGNAGIYYDLALTEYHLGNLDESMHLARSAARAQPGQKLYWRYMSWMNQQLKIERTVEPALRLYPDLFLYCMIGLVSIGFLSLIVQLMRNKAIYVIVFLLSMLLAVVSCSLLIYVAHYNDRLSGVVAHSEVVVRRIPSETASLWLKLQNGQSVDVLDKAGSFYLVRDPYGLKGWVDSSSVLLDGQVHYQ